MAVKMAGHLGHVYLVDLTADYSAERMAAKRADSVSLVDSTAG